MPDTLKTRVKIIRHWTKYNKAIAYVYEPKGKHPTLDIAICLPPGYSGEIRLPPAGFISRRFLWNLTDRPDYDIIRPGRYYHDKFRWEGSLFTYLLRVGKSLTQSYLRDKDFENYVIPYLEDANKWVDSKL